MNRFPWLQHRITAWFPDSEQFLVALVHRDDTAQTRPHPSPPDWDVAQLPLSESQLNELILRAYQLGFPAPWEQAFQRSQFRRSLPYGRLLLLSFVLGFWLFGISDHWGFPHSLVTLKQIRYHYIGPLLLGLALLSLRIKSAMWFRAIGLLSYLMGGVGILGMIAIAHPQDPGLRYGFAGLVFPIMLVQFAKLGSRWATALGALLWLGYALVGGWRAAQMAGIGQGEFGTILAGWQSGQLDVGGNLFYLGFVNLAGIAVGYALEVASRVEFLQRQALTYERERSEQLLANILPAQIIALLKEQPDLAIAQEYPMASILFADLVNFTPLAAQLPPRDLVHLLNEIFSEFDQLVEAAGLEKIKTIGDCYMVAAGVPVARSDHGEAIAHLALEMMRVTQAFVARHGHPRNLRIGIHSGSVVAGVIGRRKFLYDLWGDTVNIASRMESHGNPGQIQLSQETYELIQAQFCCQARGLLPIKGKGNLPVWQLLGQSAQDETA